MYIKKINEEQKDSLLRIPGFIEVDETNGRHEKALSEDDTYPEHILDLGTTLKELEKSRKNSELKDKYVRAKNRYSIRLRIEDYNAQRRDLLQIINSFFSIQERKSFFFSPRLF